MYSMRSTHHKNMICKIIFFICFVGMINTRMTAQTLVDGNITVNTVWTVDQSPYRITSSVTVNPGITLTINSGVTVQFDNNQCLYVFGSVEADNVWFTSVNETASPGDWGNIQVGGWDPSETGSLTLTSCQIEYARNLWVLNGTATLTNTNISNFLEHGVIVEMSGLLNMSGGFVNTISMDAASNGSGFLAKDNSVLNLTGIIITNVQNGVLLHENADVTLNDMNIYGCNWPVHFLAPASLNTIEPNIYSSNGNNVVFLNFYYVTDTLSLPYMQIPYFSPHGLNIGEGALLSIASNTILKFNMWTALDIEGTLIANAGEGENIFFTSWRDDNLGGDSNKDGTITAPGSQDWQGIRFHDSSNDNECIMRRCNIQYAGAGNVGGISMFDASPTIDYCDLSNNYFGVFIQFASAPVLTNNTIGSSNWTPIAMSLEANPVMADNILSFSDNAYDAIGLIGGTLTADAVLKTRSVTGVENISYLLLDELVVPENFSLTINKGIVVKSYTQSHRIIVEGTLTANASADSMITFTSVKDDNHGNPGDCNKDGTMTFPERGDWGGITFNPGGQGILNYCRVKYAVNNIPYAPWGFPSCGTTEYLIGAGIELIDASPSLSNCEFKDLNYGIACHRASNPVISNNSMVNIEYTPFNIASPSNPSFSGNTFTNAGWQAVGLIGGHVCQNGTIKKRNIAGYTNITYVLLGDMTINSGTYVNVEPGVVIKVNNCSIFVDGGFKTDGLSTQKVVFTSLKDDNAGNPYDSNGDGNASTPEAGNWGVIKFCSASDDSYCKLDFTTVKYGGLTGEGAVAFENAGGLLQNSLITNSSNYGVYSNGNSTPVVDKVTIQNCNLDPIAMSLTSNPLLTNITFISNFSKAIKIIEGTLSTKAVLSPRNVAGINNIAYVVDKLTISPNAKLTILPGVVIKFRGDTWPHNSYMRIQGNLMAAGKATQKIYFTSFADDSRGGDSNNNGNADAPNKGDWGQGVQWYSHWDPYPGGIMFENNMIVSDTVNILKNCELSYSAMALRIQNSHVTVDSTLIQLTNYSGLSIIGSANPLIQNSQFYNINHAPVELSLFSMPSFINCSALNVKYMALAVIPETYSQSATVPVRNFGGYDNITYFLQEPCTINTGTTITIPEGIVFKSEFGSTSYHSGWEMANGLLVNGNLKIAGTEEKPVVFTHAADDSHGNPKDTNQNGSATSPPDGYSYQQGWSGTWITFNDVSNDSSLIHHAILKYGDTGIRLLSASPELNNNLFSRLYCGVDMNGVSSPALDYNTFHNLRFNPIQISLVSYPVTSEGNVISGTTYRVIKVREETLTQDATLARRDFGGVSNIPYYFDRYSVGTGATLTIKPGVVCKFKNREWYGEETYMRVFKGLIAEGGCGPDSAIVFTSIRDDFYGGDSNADQGKTISESGEWSGLRFEDESLDPFCRLRNCVIRYGERGVQIVNASPSVTFCSISNNLYGASLTGASNPDLAYNDFKNNVHYAVNNVDKSFLINAQNCWWGSDLGPVVTETEGDGSSLQELVTESVNFVPWKTGGAGIPDMGDVSLNGEIQAYDASLVLKYVVNPYGADSLTALQRTMADVSGNGGPDTIAVTAYDASLILQYVVGLIEYFPGALMKDGSINEKTEKLLALQKKATVRMNLGSVMTNFGESVVIPVDIYDASNLMSLQFTLKYDPALICVEKVDAGEVTASATWNSFIEADRIRFAAASGQILEESGTVAYITLTIPDDIRGIVHTILQPLQVLGNEQDMTVMAVSGEVSVKGRPETYEISQNYPNPFNPYTTISYQLPQDESLVQLFVYNVAGQVVRRLVNTHQSAGFYQVVWDGKNDEGIVLPSGMYVYRLMSGDFIKSRKLILVK